MLKFKRILILVLIIVMISLTGCSIEGPEKKAKKSSGTNIDFEVNVKKAVSELTVDLFKETFDGEENTLISPTSITMALSMVANGAEGETLSQMEKVLGRGLKINQINETISVYLSRIESVDDINIANSIWINDMDSIKIKEEFLDVNSKYYNAKIYKEVFNDKTADSINSWVYEKTDGMIEKMIDSISPNSIMYLINAIAFESEWEKKYESNQVFEDEFTDYKGNKKEIEMMKSEEEKYLYDGKAVGFIKPYKDNKFSFIAILPNEDIGLEEYINQMTGESLFNMINSHKEAKVDVYIPKFSYSYETNMNQVLITLGIEDAFDELKADFSKIAEVKNENIYINKVVHKTFIEVNEKGTKAAAATGVEVNVTSTIVNEERYTVRLDRPFIYIIMDNETNMPVFIGSVLYVD